MDAEWIEFGGTWYEFNDAGLSVSGTLIEVDGSKYLIGDINTNTGVCDDCVAFEGKAIVGRYKVLIKKDW